MKKIPLSKGELALVDDADFPELSKFKWHVSFNRSGKTKYAARYSLAERKSIPMHRHLCNPPDNMEVDHINRNGLDNRRCNLRIVTHAQNIAGKAKHANTYSIYKGVTKDKGLKRKPWIAQIKKNYKNIRLGSFYSEKEAALAYNKAALELFGEYAKINQIKGGHIGISA